MQQMYQHEPDMMDELSVYQNWF